MGNRPLILQFAARRSHTFIQSAEPVPSADERGLPIEIASLDRAHQRDPFDLDARLGEVEELIDRKRRDVIALLSLRDDKSLGAQPRQRLSYRAETDPCVSAISLMRSLAPGSR